MSEAKVIKVYVRKGDSDAERRIAFRWEGISTTKLLDLGYAIDGSQACEAVVGTEDTPMPVLLRNAELRLISILEELGYTVEFL